MTQPRKKSSFADNKMTDRIDSTQEQEVWSYRGYHLKHGEFNTAMVHLFRAEVTRANLWRQRLDATTNWSVLTTAAALSFAFGEPSAHHSVIILNTLLVTLFLYIEARRYRYYELWSLRVRVLEINYFAAMLLPSVSFEGDWAKKLANSLLYPRFSISLWEALGRRLRRNYIWIYLLLGMAWIMKVGLFPEAATSFGDFLERAAIGGVNGWIVLAVGVFVNGLMFMTAIFTRHLTEATGEILPSSADFSKSFMGE